MVILGLSRQHKWIGDCGCPAGRPRIPARRRRYRKAATNRIPAPHNPAGSERVPTERHYIPVRMSGGVLMLELEVDSYGYIVRSLETGEELYFQVDWDFPGLASTFGWSPCAGCPAECKGATDGTVDCAERSVGDMINSAIDWLDRHDGEVAEDPGYFE